MSSSEGEIIVPSSNFLAESFGENIYPGERVISHNTGPSTFKTFIILLFRLSIASILNVLIPKALPILQNQVTKLHY